MLVGLIKNHTDAYYEQSKLWGKTYTRPEERDRIDDISSLIPKDVRSILDAGCGDGILANHLHENYNIVAMDRALAPLNYVNSPKISHSK